MDKQGIEKTSVSLRIQRMSAAPVREDVIPESHNTSGDPWSSFCVIALHCMFFCEYFSGPTGTEQRGWDDSLWMHLGVSYSSSPNKPSFEIVQNFFSQYIILASDGFPDYYYYLNSLICFTFFYKSY